MVDDHFQGADPGMVWLELFGIALAGGITALALLGIEVKLIKMTSTLTLEVISKVKDMIQIGLSVAIYHDVLSPLNVVGVGVLLSSVLTYVEEETRGQETSTLCFVRVLCGACYVLCVGTQYAEERERERERARLLSIRRGTHHHTRGHTGTH